MFSTSPHALHPHSALRFLSGTRLHAYLPLKHVGPIEAGVEFDVSVVVRAPEEPGQYRAVWWMDECEDDGQERTEVEVG